MILTPSILNVHSDKEIKLLSTIIVFFNHYLLIQPMEWEKVFLNHLSDQELISKIYEEFIQFNSKNKITCLKKLSRKSE